MNIILETIAEVRKHYPEISDADFNSIIRLDPTFNRNRDSVGKYAKWLLNLEKQGKLVNVEHITDLLTRFENNKNNLKNKDIMTFRSIEEVDQMLDDPNSYKELSNRQKLRQTQNKVRKTDVNKDADLVYEDDKWQVWVPNTYEASCKLGKDTSWCTASTSSDYYYDSYTSRGKLYININKKVENQEPAKIQIHLESRSFMDEFDDAISFQSLMKENEGLASFYKPLVIAIMKKDGLSVSNLINIPTNVLSHALYTSRNCDVSEEFIDACLENNLGSLFVGSGYEYVLADGNVEMYYLDRIDDYNSEIIESLGAEATDTETWSDDIWKAVNTAIVSATEQASADAAQRDFERALDYLMDDYLDDKSTWSISDGMLVIKNQSNVEDDILFDSYVNSDGAEDRLLDYANEHFRFREPQYGWTEFDDDLFNEMLEINLKELKDEDK